MTRFAITQAIEPRCGKRINKFPPRFAARTANRYEPRFIAVNPRKSVALTLALEALTVRPESAMRTMKTSLLLLVLGIFVFSAQAQARREVGGGHLNAAAPAAAAGPGQPDRAPWELDSLWITYDHRRTELQAAAKKNRADRSQAALGEAIGKPGTGGVTNSVATLDQYFANQAKAMAKYASVVKAITDTYIQKAIKDNLPGPVIQRLQAQQAGELAKYRL
jgi:hypothetical protein